MNHCIRISDWSLAGWTPYLWQLDASIELGEAQNAEIKDIPAHVPGSVQEALRKSGIIPDWNYGYNARLCEWVENRHWIYTAAIQDLPEKECECSCHLDGAGWIVWDGKIIAEFQHSHRPFVFNIPSCEPDKKHTLSIVFDLPPRWLGQFGFTSKFTVGKPRFYYTWDWVPRIVQTAIVSDVEIRPCNSKSETVMQDIWTDNQTLFLRGRTTSKVTVSLYDDDKLIYESILSVDQFTDGKKFEALPVELWYPNGAGIQKLYTLSVNGQRFKVGFRKIVWEKCLDAPVNAEKWTLMINDTPIFVQGVNWTPIRPNFADVREEEYRKRLEKYRDIGINMIRVWGGASIEKNILYQLCDEFGIMVWQEFPMSSSGIESLPPADEKSMIEVLADAEYYLSRLTPHVSLLMWSGGNELQRALDHSPYGCGKPCGLDEPLLEKLADLVLQKDPSRRFVPSSASGPREFADEKDFGKGLHWDVHGPWKTEGRLDANWRRYWKNDDALLRSEVGSPGASSANIINKYGCPWDYPLPWWDEHDTFILEYGRNKQNLEEYIVWSQKRQAEMLGFIAESCKRRFPSCGGIIIWMGHDAFPCAANTSILDFEGEYKPAALALKKIFCN